MAASSALNADVVKTLLDDLVAQDGDFFGSRPDLATVADPMLFNQLTTELAAVTTDEFAASGYYDTKDEFANAPTSSAKSFNQNSVTVSTFAQTIEIGKELFDDGQFNIITKLVRNMNRAGRMTMERDGFKIYRNALTTTFGDGAALLSNTHTLGDGTTQDNLITPALSESSLDTAIQLLHRQKDQNGVIMGFMPTALLVPPALYKLAVEITDSELRSATADNDINAYSSKYGITIKSTPFIGASESGSDVVWFLVGDQMNIDRYARESLSTNLIDWKLQKNHAYQYTARYREAYTVSSHIGIVGSDGTT